MVFVNNPKPGSTSSAQEGLRPFLDTCREPGLYLLFKDGLLVALTQSAIGNLKRQYLSDPVLMPVEVRQAVDYPPCTICPHKDAPICHALPAVFPLLPYAERMISHDTVIAAYRAEPVPGDVGDGMLHVVRTSMQRALQYVSILGLIHYCEVGRAYYHYFTGVIPFMDAATIAERVYINMYFGLRGEEAAISRLIARMRAELDFTVRCQINRVRLVCHNDAFVNAFVNTHIATQFLSPDLLPDLRARFEARSAPPGEPDHV